MAAQFRGTAFMVKCVFDIMNRDTTADPRKFPIPPAIPAAGLLLGWLLGKVWPLPLPLPAWTRWIEWPLFVIAPCIAIWAVMTFRRHNTVVDPRGKVVTIVSSGPFRYTRNPMYVSLMLLYTAGALAIGNVWVVILLAPVFLALHYGVIIPEEQYLKAAFGGQYTEYRGRVRRWI
jgi:protein-S-isoprenylcysteine O-methyltransferase Ste14